MSGHSKWSKVKHQKATTDVVKGAAFTKASRAITIAVRVGGGIGDPNGNFHLRLAIEKARDVNMPKENIARAIEKGMGEGAENFEHIVYEAYGPGGVAMLIESATDNKQRTVSLVKNLLERMGGNLASPGAVGYLFGRSGVITTQKGALSLDAVMEAALEAGADDIVDTTDMFEIYTKPGALSEVKDRLLQRGIVPDNTELIMKPTTSVGLDEQKLAAIDTLVTELEALDDVQKVFTNASNI